ncbi:MAG: 30S ribosomal protein S3ae [Candidatus Geothermarchaeota archaeon]
MSSKSKVVKGRKHYLKIKCPDLLGGIPLYDIIASNLENVIGRKIEVLLADITGDAKHQFVKVKFKIIGISGEYAETVYVGHEYFREYERSLIMRRTSYVKAIKDVKTQDGYHFRIRVGVFTTKRITNSRKKAIRRLVFQVLDKWASKYTGEALIKDMLFGKIDEEIKKVARKVYPIREGSGIMKVKLIDAPILRKLVSTQSTS